MLFRYKSKDMDIATIKNIIKAYDQVEVPKIKKAFDYYSGHHKIFSKEPSAPGRPNNIVMTNFCKQIVDTYSGYLNVGKSATDEEVVQDNLDTLEECLSEALICGISYALWFFDDSQIKAYKLNPATTLIIYDNTVAEHVIGAVTWNKYKIYEEGMAKEVVDLYVYNESTVIHYYGDTIDSVNFIDEQNHFIGSVPIVEVRSSANYQGLFEQVYTLQDSYNYLMSCYEDSRETFNNSFLVISGMGLDKDSADDLIDGTNKILNLPLSEGKAYYLIKEDNPTTTTLPVLDQIREDIYASTCTPNFLDAKFSAASGMSIRMRLTAFIQKCQTIQEWFLKSIETTRDLLGKDFEFKFNSLVPADPESEVAAATALNGIISRETLLSNLPNFVEDVPAELKRLEEESNIDWIHSEPSTSDDLDNTERQNKEDDE